MSDNKTVLLPPCSEDHNSVAAPGDKKAEVGSTCVDVATGGGDSDSGGSLSSSVSPIPPGSSTIPDDWNGVEQSDADSGVANGSTPFDCDSSLLSLNSSCASGDGSACLTTSPTVLVENACQSLSGDDGSLIATAVMNEPVSNAAGDTLPPASAQTKQINVSAAHDSCNRHSANNNNSGSIRSNGETVTVGAPARDTTPNETGTQQQYVVNVHVNAGETFSVRVGDRVQLIHGPATVRMVSNSGPPVPMPMQVPPGHMVQQIVDENGILTHVILSPQPPGIPAPPTMMGAPNCAPVYPAFGPSYAPFTPHYAAHYPGITARHMHPMMGSHLHHGPVPTAAAVPPQPHHHQCSSHLHHPPHVHTPVSTPQTAHRANHVPTAPAPAPPQQPSIDDRTMRTRARLRNKLGRRKPSESSIQRKGSNVQRTASSESHEVQVVQADSKSGNNSSFDDNQEPDEEMKIIHDLLSKLEPPKVLDIEAKSALIQLSMPIINQAEVDVDASEFIYELSLSEKVDNGFMVFYSGDATEITLRDLKPATDYFVRVCCLLDNIRGDPAKPVPFRTSAAEPDAPQSPKLQAKAKTHLQLKWTPPADNGSKITLYSLEYDQGKGDAKFVEVYCGPQKQFKVPKLSPSTSYAFRLVAINAIGRSRYSETVVYCTSGTVPLQTDPPMLSECCVKALTISWVRRPCDETFTLQMEDEATGHGFLNVYNGPELSHKIAQLRRNTEYKFRLAATNEEGTGKWSEVVCFRTLPDRPQPPPKPQLKGRLTSNSFRVVWDEPKDTGGVDVQDYQVQLDAGNGYQMAHRTAEREFVAEQLEPGHTYRIRICCYSSGGQSDWSEVLIVTTQAVAPGQCKPPRLHGRPKSTFVTIAWEYPEDDGGSTITEYAVMMSGNELVSQREVYRGHDTQCSVASLLPGRTYSFQVRACNKAGWGSWSEALEVLTSAGVPDAPCQPEVHCKSPHVATISWEEPPCNGATVSEYHLEWQLHEEQDFSVLYAGPCNVYELNKLTPATSYGFRVQALNSVGAGPFSPVSWCQTLASSPSAVTSVRASSTETSLCISWKEPVCNGSKVTSYNIDIGDPMRPLITVDANTLDYTVTDLQPETAYKIRVQAVNAIGIGAFSTPVKVTTRALPPSPPTIECVMIGSNSLKLKWGDGKNPDLIRFCLEMRRENISFQAVYQGTGHMHKVTKLNESTTYQFRIFASNDAGDGPVSPIYSYCTTKAPPAAMKAPKVTEMNVTSCTIEWALPKPSSSDTLVYVLQLQRMLGKDQDYHEIYRGTAHSFHLDNLTSNSDYQVRVCAVRNLVDELGATVSLTGPFSPGTPFTTLGSPKSSAELNQVQASGSSSKPVMVSGAAGLTDQAWACILLLVFAVIAVGVAFFAQQIIN